MTVNEFITKFSKITGQNGWGSFSGRKWSTGWGGIRYTNTANMCFCPITAVSYENGGSFDSCDSPESTLVAARKLGLSDADAKQIMAAADNNSNCNKTLRKRLINLAQR